VTKSTSPLLRRAHSGTTWPPTSQLPSKPSPKRAPFFDSLAQFYRNAYLRWIDSTKRSPEMRAVRITETVALLKAGEKERR